MKSTIGLIAFVVYLGIGIAKGWEQEVYLFLGIFGLVLFNAAINAEFLEGVHKKIDEVIKALKN